MRIEECFPQVIRHFKMTAPAGVSILITDVMNDATYDVDSNGSVMKIYSGGRVVIKYGRLTS